MAFEARSVTSVILGAVVGAMMGAVLAMALSTGNSTTLYATSVAQSTAVTGASTVVPQYIRAAHQGSRFAEVAPQAQEAPVYNAETTFVAPQGATWQHLQWALVGFVGVAAAINGFLLTYWSRKNISLAAITGEKDEETGFSRRQALIGASAAAGIASAAPAYAIFGWGEDANAVYADATTKLVDEIKSVLVLDGEDPSRPERIADLRKNMNTWVATYRRDPKFAGRASFGNLYSVINAIAGHYTNFGIKTPIPKKRAAQIVVEIGQAEQLVSKGR